RRVGAIIRRVCPHGFVTLSSDVWPEFREFPRANTTVVSAYVGPTVQRYVEELEARLRSLGMNVGLQIMQSSGGTTSAAAVAFRSVRSGDQGAEAGAIAPTLPAQSSGPDDLIQSEMGGPPARVGAVQGAKPPITHDFAVGGYASAGLKRVAAGYPVKLPVIDL